MWPRRSFTSVKLRTSGTRAARSQPQRPMAASPNSQQSPARRARWKVPRPHDLHTSLSQRVLHFTTHFCAHCPDSLASFGGEAGRGGRPSQPAPQICWCYNPLEGRIIPPGSTGSASTDVLQVDSGSFGGGRPRKQAWTTGEQEIPSARDVLQCVQYGAHCVGGRASDLCVRIVSSGCQTVEGIIWKQRSS